MNTKIIKIFTMLEISQNISEIRDVIKSMEKMRTFILGGIPMIADDMMSYIKSDIVIFGIGVFIFIVLTLWLIFRNLKWVDNAIIRLLTSVISNDWTCRFNWMEGNCNFIKFYRFNVNFKYGNEYSCYCQIFTIKKRISNFQEEAIFVSK